MERDANGAYVGSNVAKDNDVDVLGHLHDAITNLEATKNLLFAAKAHSSAIDALQESINKIVVVHHQTKTIIERSK
jgi:hypothetical protein